MKQGTTGFLRSGTFKKQQFEEDRERIVTYCRNQGYLDAAVTDVELNFREDREELDLVIHVAEGERYYIGDVNWQGNTVFDDLAIADLIWMEKGEVFKEDEYLETLANLQQLYADRGYIYITVEPQRDIVDQTVNVDFHLHRGPAGQDPRHPDQRQHQDLRQGDPAGDAHLPGRHLQQHPHPGHHAGHLPDRASSRTSSRTSGRCANGDVDMILKVKEKQTGQFMFGMAYSAETSASGFIQVAETNFQGKGQNLGLTWQFGSRAALRGPQLHRALVPGHAHPDRRRHLRPLPVQLRRFLREPDPRLQRPRWAGAFPGPATAASACATSCPRRGCRNFSPAYIGYLDDLEESLGTSDLPWQRLDEIDWPQLKSSIRLTLNRNSHRQPVLPHRGLARPATASSWPAARWAGRSSSRSTCSQPLLLPAAARRASPCTCGASSG